MLKRDLIETGSRFAPVWNSFFGRVALALAAAILTAATFVAGNALFGYRLLEKRPLNADWYDFSSSVGLAVAGCLLFLALRPAGSARRDYGLREVAWLSIVSPVVIAVLPLSAVAVALWPDSLHTFVREGRPLSIATEIAFIGALIVLSICVRRSFFISLPRIAGLPPVVVAGGMWAVTFLILMEEMSWGQHWLGFSTPDVFAENLQNETNLHNFYTYRFEAAYYSAAVIAFVLLPFTWPEKPHPAIAGATIYIPPRAFALAAIPLCSLMYESVSIVIYQVWFFAGLLICWDIWRNDHQRLALIALVMLIVSQSAYLYFGPALEHGHELTEVREFVIALCVFGYSCLLNRRLVLAAESAGAGTIANPDDQAVRPQ